MWLLPPDLPVSMFQVSVLCDNVLVSFDIIVNTAYNSHCVHLAEIASEK